MYKNGLYHVSCLWDEKFELYTQNNICMYSSIGISYTRHYQNQYKDREIPIIPDKYVLLNGKIIEVEIEDNKVTKALIRTKYDKYTDIITVIRFTNIGLKYITGWSNNNKDHHDTLDISKYIRE